MKRHFSLTAELSRWFDTALADLPAEIRKQVERHFCVFPWDNLSSVLRRRLAKQVDEQYPTNVADKLIVDPAFRAGLKKVSVPRRNRLNAKKPRPSRQKVSDAEILRIQRELKAEGVQQRRLCSIAYQRWTAESAEPISLRGFRKRWNRLGLNK